MAHTGLYPHYCPQGPFIVPETIPDAVLQHHGWLGASERELREIFALCGVGMVSDPGKLGLKVNLANWEGGKHSLPSYPVIWALKEHASGPRVETIGRSTEIRTGPGIREMVHGSGQKDSNWVEQERIRIDHEIKAGRGADADIRAAYPSHYRRHPTGTGIRIHHPDVVVSTWFMECRARIRAPLPLGPFPVSGCNGWYWPTATGTYHTWIWKEQADDARDAGAEVEPIHGWGWLRMTDDNAPWVDRMIGFREQAGWNTLQGKILKNCANFAIGKANHGTHYSKWTRDYREGAWPVTVGDEIGEGWRYLVRGRRTPVHWYYYTVMQCSRQVYHMALPYAEQGRLDAIRTDAIYVRPIEQERAA